MVLLSQALALLMTFSLASSSLLLNPLVQEGINDDYDYVDGGFSVKPFGLRIMPLGASIVFGYRSTDGNGFRSVLREKLRHHGWKVDMVGSHSNGTMCDRVGIYFVHLFPAMVN